MKSIIDYAQTKFDSFESNPLNQVDSLIFSQLSYIHFEAFNIDAHKRICLKELLKAEYFNDMFSVFRNIQSNKDLLFAVGMNPRYRDVQICNYVNHIDNVEEKQFSAVTFILPNSSLYVAFRGTDSTITGWKEDFNMTFMKTIPSQLDSVKYLESTAGLFNGSIYVGGHSKGGNLAVYASAYANKEISDRIIAVYSHDGPGFNKEILVSDEFKNVEERILKTIPKQSIVGILLENQETYKVVKSNRLGIMQHDPFSWLIENDSFIYCDNISQSSLHMNEHLNKWLTSISYEERQVFVDTLFSIFNTCEISSTKKLSEKWLVEIPNMIKSFENIDSETKHFILQTIKALIAVK